MVECELCPKVCRIAPGESGECRIRVNIDGQLKAVTYGYPSALHVDPIEKKPLYHFRPRTRILSVATVGCNLHCKNCQNWQLSQTNPEDAETHQLSPARLVQLAERERCPAIAYTYSEPIVFYEYTYDTSKLARERGIANALVTAGFANPAPMRELFQVTDAANIDLKVFDDRLYQSMTTGRLAPILHFIELAQELGVWIELTNLVIPTFNDDDGLVRRMCRWIVEHLGADVPLHFSRFTPRHKLRNLPPTPAETLLRVRELALAEGLRYVYIGNLRGNDGSDTRCPNDGTLLIERRGYHVPRVDVDGEGKCPTCATPIAGVWSEES